jgi:hypothetical protein
MLARLALLFGSKNVKKSRRGKAISMPVRPTLSVTVATIVTVMNKMLSGTISAGNPAFLDATVYPYQK